MAVQPVCAVQTVIWHSLLPPANGWAGMFFSHMILADERLLPAVSAIFIISIGFPSLRLQFAHIDSQIIHISPLTGTVPGGTLCLALRDIEC
nr:hypothetical protein [uncultured Butyricicoccus sp.]